MTTEISQVPLSGVEALLDLALLANIPSLLDVDVPPSVATGAAALGDMDTLRRCIEKCTVLKPTLESAQELLALAGEDSGEDSGEGSGEGGSDAVALAVQKAFGKSMVVVTDGSRGCALAVDNGTAVRVPVKVSGHAREIIKRGACGCIVHPIHRVPQTHTPSSSNTPCNIFSSGTSGAD